tara:strand:- start:12 stop:563 length:552 start_codon:yes stop_codon:yes gene_type:complete
MSISITGNTTLFPNNLTGKCLDKIKNINSTPLQVIKIKKTVIDKFIIPLHLQQWQTIKENYFLLDRLARKINKNKIYYKNYDLEIYEYFVNFIKSYFNQHTEFQDLENKLYHTDNNSNIATLFYKTPSIKLKAEYEIYNLIFGKPNKQNKEIYNILYINKIIDLLKDDDITFDKIKNQMSIYL